MDVKAGAPTARRRVWTPLGDVLVEADAAGVTSLRFSDRGGPAGAYDAPAYDAPAHDAPAHRLPAIAAAQIAEYFAGARRAFDVPLSLKGTGFQQKVWRALLDIPYGGTRSYAQIAAAVGRPGAARAVGAACRANPVLILVPCHRVVAADGGPGGYAGGVDRKRRLLALEADGD